MTEPAEPRLDLEAEHFRFRLQQVLASRALDWLSAPYGRAAPGPQRPAFVPPRQIGAERLGNGNFFAVSGQRAPAEWRLYLCRDGARFIFDDAMTENQTPAALVEAAFRLVLARDPDPAGRDQYRMALEHGEELPVMMRALAASAEARRPDEILLLQRAPAVAG